MEAPEAGMAARALEAAEVGLPRFSFAVASPAEVFDLDSHRRAREALDFGLSVSGMGFNVFVVGDDRVQRMTATLAYLHEALKLRPPQSDWIYLNNFRNPARPTPHRLPAGMGRSFRDALAALVPRLRAALAAAFGAEAYQARFMALREAAQEAVAQEMEQLRATAKSHGMELVESQDGAMRLVRSQAAEGAPEAPPLDEAAERELSGAFARLQRRAVDARTRLAAAVEDLNRVTVDDAAGPMLDSLQGEYSGIAGLARWITEMKVDILDNPARLRPATAEREGAPDASEAAERRYAVNLLVDHTEESRAGVVLESNPTYENVFGRIEYRQAQGTVETDFTLIRAGALHRANGGILVLRAEAVAANPATWSFLKAALRDREIRIEELARVQMTPIAGAPQPRPIPLELKVVIVGAPRWYSLFFSGDPDFYVYFKIKADIDSDMEASPANLAVYAALIGDMARAEGLAGASEGAIRRLLGIAARWADRRDRLSAHIELIEDLVTESAVRDHHAKSTELTETAVRETHTARRRRNARVEDRAVRSIIENEVMIDTAGAAVGQVNALTVYDMGDRRFGTPVRVSARASVGRLGIVNIERDVALGGPIQQKGAMVLQGFLAGCFAQLRPLSFTCSITFEQSYGGVEGDSASMAELVAVLSDLAQLPVRQDIAMTGSVNQAGHAQTIGGAYTKVEGFFRVCQAKPGGLTGTQGVVLPEANRAHVMLHDELAEAVAAGRFHLWSVTSVAEAAELMLAHAAGDADSEGNYPPHTIFGRAAARLAAFDRILAARRVGSIPEA
jgi:predicted ATP-dependent protease